MTRTFLPLPRRLSQVLKPVSLLLVVVVGFVLAGCGPISAQSEPGEPAQATGFQGGTRSSEGGGVTITATWGGPDGGLLFDVVMETHSVDLDGYDLRDLATVRVNSTIERAPSTWDAPKGGHHRRGRLTFPDSTDSGDAIDWSQVSTVELIIREVGGVQERVLTWVR